MCDMRKSLREYLRRMGKAHGFGIQSPWAYSFVKDVITETLPYYIYEEIDAKAKSHKDAKYQKLFHRLRNYAHDDKFVMCSLSELESDSILREFQSLGSRGIVVIEGINESPLMHKKWEDIRDSECVGITFDLYDMAICFAPNGMYKQHYLLNF